MPNIKQLHTAKDWQAIVSASNANAINKQHQYPLFERGYFEFCLEYVDTVCNANCFCKQINNQGAWVIKPDLSFAIFLEHYANLWAKGQSDTLKKMVSNQSLPAKG